MKTQTKGFTLIELVVVIVILGILAATALPKFVDLGSDARKAKLKSIQGTLQTTANLFYAKAMIAGVQDKYSATMNYGNLSNVAVYWGYPARYTMIDIVDISDITPDMNAAGWTARYQIQSNCYVDYVASPAPFKADAMSITLKDSGC